MSDKSYTIGCYALACLLAAEIGFALGTLTCRYIDNGLPVYIVTVDKDGKADTGITNRLHLNSDGTVEYTELGTRKEHSFKLTDKYTVEELTESK